MYTVCIVWGMSQRACLSMRGGNVKSFETSCRHSFTLFVLSPKTLPAGSYLIQKHFRFEKPKLKSSIVNTSNQTVIHLLLVFWIQGIKEETFPFLCPKITVHPNSPSQVFLRNSKSAPNNKVLVCFKLPLFGQHTNRPYFSLLSFQHSHPTTDTYFFCR